EVPVAVAEPSFSLRLFLLFGLVGLYVGIVPIGLGMAWFPFMRRLGTAAMNFVLALTVGLLLFLAVGTYLDATELAAGLPAFWQGLPMVLFVALGTLGVLLAVSQRRRGRSEDPLGTSYRIALGIGLQSARASCRLGVQQAGAGVTLH